MSKPLESFADWCEPNDHGFPMSATTHCMLMTSDCIAHQVRPIVALEWLITSLIWLIASLIWLIASLIRCDRSSLSSG